MLLSNCVFSGEKKSTFIKKQETNNISDNYVKMNKLINKFLLTGDQFMPELHLTLPEFTYSAC